MYLFFLGIDLGSECHQVRLLDCNGQTVAERSVEHGGLALGQFLDWLVQSTSAAAAGQVAVGVEAPRGAFIDALLERGYAVFSINPKQLDRFRDHFSVAGAKDDRRDALVLADSLRTDRRHFRLLWPDDPRILRLRELSRAEASLQRDLRRGSNRLWSYLQRYFPALLGLCSSAGEAWLWDLLRRCHARPSRAAKMRRQTLDQLLRRHRIRRFSAQQLQETLRHPLPLVPGVEPALAEQVLLLLPRLQLFTQQRRQLAARIDPLVDQLAADDSFPEHRSIAILRSVPGLGRIAIATVLAEAFQPLQDRDYHAWRALAGVAPVTKQSGKTLLVLMRRACNRRLRHAIFHAANAHWQRDPRARQAYVRLRQKGNTHARALRGVADRLLELTCVLLRRQTLYDPDRRATPSKAA
jgi:transposase